jgi:hypothetical protein
MIQRNVMPSFAGRILPMRTSRWGSLPNQSLILLRAYLDCSKGRVPAFVGEMVAILLTVRFPFRTVEAWDPKVI